GPRTAGISPDYPGSLLDIRLRPDIDFTDDAPEPERALDVVTAAAFRLPAGDDGRLRIRPTPAVTHLTGDEPYVVLHPGATVPARRWPAWRCAEAVRALGEAGHRVLVTGGPNEKDLTAEVAGDTGVDLGGATDFAELAGVLRGAEVVVVGNTGPAHLAAAVGTPVVSLFSPVVPAIRWAPYGVPAVLLGDQTAACRGTRARECPLPGHPCLTSVTAADVVSAVVSVNTTMRGHDTCASR
ncbi:glycosyltransferase family 9 protein, partial [Actinophytocola sp.]|uniref:glycosyltransferase family 9 protein n=1 Tax=Actinophytocola sp. TaxID=1872138 RepID=UPI003899B975